MSSSHPTPAVRRLRGEQPIEKAARLLGEQRVRILPEAHVYLVAGDSNNYRVIADALGIHCPCPARTPLCAHVLAVATIEGRERAGRVEPPELSVRAGVLR